MTRALLPIDPLLPGLVERLREAGAAVVEAPPGAGKTTRVPLALLEGGLAGGRDVVVLEPRRLAARLAARRIAAELGESVGERVGYEVRFESATSERTRLRFVTQGVFSRQLLSDPHLGRVGVIVLDEFHERQLEGDVALAMGKHLRAGGRPDLRVCVMSATLDAEPIASFLGGCPRLRSDAAPFEVAIEHASTQDERPLGQQVASAVRRIGASSLDGDVLVFLPGAAEIRQAYEALRPLAAQAGVELAILHGDLPPEEQDRALLPAAQGRRKVLLSTNVAETSLTIEGVTVVIDSGWARIASQAPWSGLPMLKLAKISRASARQRAGRAGRTRPGRCYRLYTAHDCAARPEHELPEVARVDLAQIVLTLHALGFPDARTFPWFEAPPEAALSQAEQLLRRLGALDAPGRLAPLGRRMLRLPLHPRAARIVCEAEARGVAAKGCRVAAELAERLPRRRSAMGGGDPSERSDLLGEANWEGAVARRLERVARQLERLCDRRAAPPRDPEEALLVSILTGYPDRVARRRHPLGRELLLAQGGAAVQHESSRVRDAELLVALEAEERRQAKVAGATLIVHAASAVEPEWLVACFPDRLRQVERLELDEARGRVQSVKRLLYDELVLEERTGEPEDTAEASRVLLQAVKRRGPETLFEPAAMEQWLARLAVARQAAPEAHFPALEASDLASLLERACQGKTSLAEIEQGGGLLGVLAAELSPAARGLMERLAPERFPLPSGRSRPIEYRPDAPPCVQVRLQELFGVRETPRIAGGRVPLVLHLLAPNGRAVQVTSDLGGFWVRTYPQVRKELARRYPKHAWPEDPLTPPRRK